MTGSKSCCDSVSGASEFGSITWPSVRTESLVSSACILSYRFLVKLVSLHQVFDFPVSH